MAREHPEMFAVSYGTCDRCGAMYCDACVNEAGGKCPACGRRIELAGPPTGKPVELPPEYRRVLDEIDKPAAPWPAPRPAPSPPARATAPQRVAATPRGAGGSPKAAVGFVILLALVAAASGAVILLAGSGTAANRSAWAALNVVGVAFAFLAAAPTLGALIAGLLVALHDAVLSSYRPLRTLRRLRALLVVVLVASPLLIVVAHGKWGWPHWRIAFAYAAVLGAVIGGLVQLAQRAAKLRGAS